MDSRPASATTPRCGRLNIPPAACAATFGGDGTRVEATDTGDTFGPCISAMSGAFPPLTFVVMEGENVELEELFVVQLFISPVRSQMDRPRAFHGMMDSRPASATSPRCGWLNIPPAACAATSGTVMSGAFELPLKNAIKAPPAPFSAPHAPLTIFLNPSNFLYKSTIPAVRAATPPITIPIGLACIAAFNSHCIPVHAFVTALTASSAPL